MFLEKRLFSVRVSTRHLPPAGRQSRCVCICVHGRSMFHDFEQLFAKRAIFFNVSGVRNVSLRVPRPQERLPRSWCETRKSFFDASPVVRFGRQRFEVDRPLSTSAVHEKTTTKERLNCGVGDASQLMAHGPSEKNLSHVRVGFHRKFIAYSRSTSPGDITWCAHAMRGVLSRVHKDAEPDWAERRHPPRHDDQERARS